MVRYVLSLRKPDEWTLLTVSDLIANCCEARRQPKRLLFTAIEWLVKAWPYHIVLIPTSRGTCNAHLFIAAPGRFRAENFLQSVGWPVYFPHPYTQRHIGRTLGDYVMMAEILQRLGLCTNPFEPAATGAPLFGTLTPPSNLAKKTNENSGTSQIWAGS